jgi:hypothetical protein
MPTESELLEAIEIIENQESSFENCVKLSIYYDLYDRYYNNKNDFEKNKSYDYKNNSSVADLLKNQDFEYVINLFSEVLDCLEIINPKMYESIISRLK